MKKITLTSDKKVSNRKYMQGANWAKVTEITTPQARKCAEILGDALKARKVTKITELEMKEEIAKRGTELKTRQEPWHIFMYYRPALIELGVLQYAPEEKPVTVQEPVKAK